MTSIIDVPFSQTYSVHILCFKCICSSYFLDLFSNFFTPFTLLIHDLLWIESVNICSGDLFEIT